MDTLGSKYTVSTIQAVTDGTDVDWAQFGGQVLGGDTGQLALNLDVIGGNTVLELQVTPASSNSTLWTTQIRMI